MKAYFLLGHDSSGTGINYHLTITSTSKEVEKFNEKINKTEDQAKIFGI